MVDIQSLMPIAREIVAKHDGMKFKGGTIRNENKWYAVPGDIVLVRSVKDEHGNGTHLGVYVGEWYDDAPCHGIKMGNPAFYVLDMKTIVRGFESWWKKLSDLETDGKTVEEILKEHAITGEIIETAIKDHAASAIVIGKKIHRQQERK